jgi:hypothetical protein
MTVNGPSSSHAGELCLHDERLGYPRSMGSFVSPASAKKLFQSGPFDFQKVL